MLSFPAYDFPREDDLARTVLLFVLTYRRRGRVEQLSVSKR